MYSKKRIATIIIIYLIANNAVVPAFFKNPFVQTDRKVYKKPSISPATQSDIYEPDVAARRWQKATYGSERQPRPANYTTGRGSLITNKTTPSRHKNTPNRLLENRLYGGMLLAALGDMLGSSLEMAPYFNNHTISGDDFANLTPNYYPALAAKGRKRRGKITDDTAWMLMLSDSLVQQKKLDVTNVMQQRALWLTKGRAAEPSSLRKHELSDHFADFGRANKQNRSAFYFKPGTHALAHGYGRASINALDRWLAEQILQYSPAPYSSQVKAGQLNLESKGNGTLMCLLPIAGFYWQQDPEALQEHAFNLSWCIHQNPTAVEAARLLAQLQQTLLNQSNESTTPLFYHIKNIVLTFQPLSYQNYLKAAPGANTEDKNRILLAHKQMTQDLQTLRNFIKHLNHCLSNNQNCFECIKSFYKVNLKDKIANKIFTGDVINSLQIAFWACAYADRFDEPAITSIKLAVSLGGDTDTYAAIAGGIAGLFYSSNDPDIQRWQDLFLGKGLSLALQNLSQSLINHTQDGWDSKLLDQPAFAGLINKAHSQTGSNTSQTGRSTSTAATPFTTLQKDFLALFKQDGEISTELNTCLQLIWGNNGQNGIEYKSAFNRVAPKINLILDSIPFDEFFANPKSSLAAKRKANLLKELEANLEWYSTNRNRPGVRKDFWQRINASAYKIAKTLY